MADAVDGVKERKERKEKERKARKGKNEGRNDIGVIGIGWPKVKEIIQDNVFDLFFGFLFVIG